MPDATTLTHRFIEARYSQLGSPAFLSVAQKLGDAVLQSLEEARALIPGEALLPDVGNPHPLPSDQVQWLRGLEERKLASQCSKSHLLYLLKHIREVLIVRRPMRPPFSVLVSFFLVEFEKQLCDYSSCIHASEEEFQREREAGFMAVRDREQADKMELTMDRLGYDLEGSVFLEKVNGENSSSLSELEFEIVRNDGTDESNIKLVAVKNIFATQLPKMPKDYVVRLVFDHKHRSLCMSRKGKIIGGICYRPFYSQGFAEIVFLAVMGTEQVKGFGTILMNHLKEYVKPEHIGYFLTYADNHAVGFFRKQGFTKNQTMERERWYGFIKDYDGGTLMECKIHPYLNYLAVKELIRMQKEAWSVKMRDISRSHIVYPGLKNIEKGVGINVMDIPGIAETGYKPPARVSTRGASDFAPSPFTELSANLAAILKEIRNSKDSWPFLEPVDTKLVPDYQQVIKHPMDLSTMMKRVNEHFYRNREMFESDFNTIVSNCKTYNSPDTTYYRCALALESRFQQIIARVWPESTPNPDSSS